jgi:hypothetical protein
VDTEAARIETRGERGDNPGNACAFRLCASENV